MRMDKWIDQTATKVWLKRKQNFLNIILTRRHDQCENQIVYKKHLCHSSMTNCSQNLRQNSN